jgi:hypothetical protein
VREREKYKVSEERKREKKERDAVRDWLNLGFSRSDCLCCTCDVTSDTHADIEGDTEEREREGRKREMAETWRFRTLSLPPAEL